MDNSAFISRRVQEIKSTVGDEGAISALSGGVDSSTCTMLASLALGRRLKTIFIDDGLMREAEPRAVQKAFAKLKVKVDVLNARSEFFAALRGLTDPEDKRKAFRNTFYSTFGREIRKSGARFLVQGTIKPDIIETRGGVKTQHNILEQIGIDPEKGYGFKVIEPLKDLYKPEVREVARALGLPSLITERMPFPGPGLCCRVVGEVTPPRVALVRRATKIIEEEFALQKPFQAFAVLLADQGTGVEKGRRKFGPIIIIRSVESQDAMTAEPTPASWDVLRKTTRRILKEMPSVTRVAYELTPKPPATIEYI